MRQITGLEWLRCLAIVGLGAMAVRMIGCAKSSATRPSTEAMSASLEGDEIDGPVRLAEMSGAQLWEQSCARCHYMRPPRWYSDTEWDVAMLHMRVQLNLTGAEHRKILEYLRAAN